MSSKFGYSYRIAMVLAFASLLVSRGVAEDPAVAMAKRVATFQESRQIPGLAVAVSRDGDPVCLLTNGWADVENRIPVTAQTFFRFASVSKAMTGVLATKLREEGLLDFEAPIGSVWRQAPEVVRDITLRQLLCHQSGLRHYQPRASLEPTRHYNSLQARINDTSAEALLYDPGTRYSYSTYGYVVAGRVLEAATQRSYLKLIQAELFEQAGMVTARDGDIYALIPHRTRGYFIGVDGALRNSEPFDPSGKLPGGGLGGAIVDLLRFGETAVRGKLLTEESRDFMWSAQSLASGQSTEYGIGWSVSRRGKSWEAYHTGSQPGASAIIFIQPEGGVVIAILANLEQVNFLPLARQLASLL